MEGLKNIPPTPHKLPPIKTANIETNAFSCTLEPMIRGTKKLLSIN
jgi:hypothetical protein